MNVILDLFYVNNFFIERNINIPNDNTVKARTFILWIPQIQQCYKYMLLQLDLPSFDTVLHNARIRFANNMNLLDNIFVSVSCRL